MNNKLSIQDLASALTERYGMDAKSAGTFVRTVFEIVEEYISKDKLVKIKGLGTFKLVSVSDRESVNVNTGERILIAGHSKLSFTPDAALKDAVNRPFSDFETTVLRDTTSTEDMERIPSNEAAGNPKDDIIDADVEEMDAVEQSGAMDTEPLSVADDTVGQEAGTPLPAIGADVAETAPVDIVPAADAVLPEPLESNATNGKMPDIAEPEPEANAEITNVQQDEEVPQDEHLAPDQPGSAVETQPQDASEAAKPIVDSHNQENSVYPMASESISTTDSGRHRIHGWLYAFLTLLLMALSYMAGHYHVHDKLEINFYPEGSIEGQSMAPIVDKGTPQDAPSLMDSVSCEVVDSLRPDTIAVYSDAAKPTVSVMPDEDPAEVAKYFPQVPGGSYWIIGDAGRVHFMEVGETLYKVAKKELGDQNLVRYLIAFNKFEDPNVIHTGDTIRIPKLVKK